ncbi:hypothetical protein EYF80_015467 [Liparis tanakae]|uniref:Uncharacterized protein n=1 Tax=Liparis tanakae TaxID=230148 RepID=A0A4Z2IA87_9TELE|nr:hypothetical protein EYF80_015467 [Liparis tanakae]
MPNLRQLLRTCYLCQQCAGSAHHISCRSVSIWGLENVLSPPDKQQQLDTSLKPSTCTSEQLQTAETPEKPDRSNPAAESSTSKRPGTRLKGYGAPGPSGTAAASPGFGSWGWSEDMRREERGEEEREEDEEDSSLYCCLDIKQVSVSPPGVMTLQSLRVSAAVQTPARLNADLQRDGYTAASRAVVVLISIHAERRSVAARCAIQCSRVHVR